MYRSFATSLLISFLLLAAHVTPAWAISISYNTGEGGKAVSSWQNFNLDDTAFLSEATILDSGKLYQTRQAAGSGSNSIKQLLSGNGYTVENSIDSVGTLSVASSAAASPESADLSQQVAGTGELSASIQGIQGTDSAGQEASVLGGVLSSSQSLSASAGDGVSAAQATEMAGIIGRVTSGAVSEEKAMITSGSFLGAGTLEAGMSSQSKGQSQASMAVDGVEWMKQSDLDKVSQEGVGMAVEGLRFDRLGDLGSFSMQAASLDRADYEIDKADRAEIAASSDKSSEKDGVGSAVMYLNNPNAYILAGWKWTQNNPQIKMYLKKDANFNNEGLDAVATKNAIEAAANTWDDAVSQNLFADSNLVTVTEASNINTDTNDGYNTHGWKPLTEGLAISRTYFSTAKVGGYYPALESDITYDSDYQWATNGGDIDVQSVALHEMGHTIGLGDLYGKPEYASDTDEIMHYYDGPQHTLGVGDLTGVRMLYGGRNVALRDLYSKYFCAEGSGGREVVANRDWIGPWETFDFIDLGNNNVALRASNGQYVCAEGSGGREVVANRNAIGPWETFGLVDSGDNNVALRAYNGQYVCVTGSSGSRVMANGNSVDSPETLRLIDLRSNNIALRVSNGQYVCAEGSGGREVVANRNAVGPWETFGLVNLGDSNVALRASNNQYVCAEGSGGREVVANRDWIGPWETFGLVDSGNNNVALRVSNGQYVTAVNGGGSQVMANSNSIGLWATLGIISLN